jgi:hypothetical protein
VFSFHLWEPLYWPGRRLGSRTRAMSPNRWNSRLFFQVSFTSLFLGLGGSTLKVSRVHARNAHAYTPTRTHTNIRTSSAHPSIQRPISSHLHVQTAFARRSMHFPREFAGENPTKPSETVRKPRRDRDSNSFCAPSSHPSRAPISTRLGTLTWHAQAKRYPA